MSSDDRDRRNLLIFQLQQLGQVNSTSTALFQQAAAASYGLGITDMKALELLMQEESLTAGELALKLGISTGAVTGVVDRLEGARMVTRGPHPDDRRKVVVRANIELITASDNVYMPIGRAFAELQAGYTTSQLEFLVKYYESANEIIAAETAKLSRG